MAKENCKSINCDSISDVLGHIKKGLDTTEKCNHIKITTLYAYNASGKTRLSKSFYDQYEESVLYYNAFTEDLFSWDNDNYVLNIKNSWIFKIIEDQGLDRQIINVFKKFMESKKLEPVFDLNNNNITFRINSTDVNSIKISRGEESVFIWSIFYTILNNLIDELNEAPDNRSKHQLANIKYVVIDDPVSSMDDARIITIAFELMQLIAKSNNKLKFLITTHHALFFNVLFNIRNVKFDKEPQSVKFYKKNYVLSKSDTNFLLKYQKKDSPFAYHHVAMAEIERSIKDDTIKKYHFNIFRSLLEKTANFLGYSHWKDCLPEAEDREFFTKIISHYSHNTLSDLEVNDLTNDDKSKFKSAFDSFMKKYEWDKNARN